VPVPSQPKRKRFFATRGAEQNVAHFTIWRHDICAQGCAAER
jgi:hypothetical protein